MLTLQISIVVLLILVNGFFSLAEMALVSARRARLQPMAADQNPGAEAALEFKNDPSRLLATVQIGITVIAVLSGTYGQATLGERLQEVLEAQGSAIASYAHLIAGAVVVIGISYFSLILGELVPKRIALSNPERIAARIARPMRWVARLAAPLEWLLSATSDVILRLLPLRRDAPSVTDEEIAFMLREGAAAGHIPAGEAPIVEMALRLGDRRVSAVMTPRMQIEFLDLDDAEEEIRRRIRDSAYSRFPVVEGAHQLAGIVQVKDLLAAALDGQPVNVRAALRAPLFVPNTVTVLRALEVFKTSGEPLALVVDEYGDLEGLVTLTDILEALVGDIPGAGEVGDPRIVRREDGTLLVDGMLGLDELKQLLGVAQLPGEDPDFHTLGGYLMARLNRVPMVADRVAADRWRFEIVEMDGRRVDRVLIAPVRAKTIRS
jgi:magnesium and cobalt exporter, CNNM family